MPHLADMQKKVKLTHDNSLGDAGTTTTGFPVVNQDLVEDISDQHAVKQVVGFTHIPGGGITPVGVADTVENRP